MNTFIVALVSSLVLTTFGAFADSNQKPEVPTSVTGGICSSNNDCGDGQCCLETVSVDMAVVTCRPLAGPEEPCSNRTEADFYSGHCPCKPGLECFNGVCTALPEPVPVQ
uniref:Putative ixodegrin protein n=1 Tax=Ixodes ricinus TaxID=34613 RepID=A0A0K8RCG0_IXORI